MSLSLSSRHLHKNLNNAPCAAECSVLTMKTDVYIMCEVPTTVNLMKVACLMLNHIFPIYKKIIRVVCLKSLSLNVNK